MKIIKGNVDLDYLYLKELPEFLSSIDKIEGYLSICFNEFKTLKNCPREVGESFYTSNNNKISNLVGGPVKVNKNYLAHNCKDLISLEGIPEVIGGDLRITSNYKLLDFSYFPKKINGDFEVGHYLGGNLTFPDKFNEKYFRSICDIKGEVKIYRTEYI